MARFSPDGRWVVSGAEDASIKIWDLTAGKLLHEFQQRPSPMVALDFHPHEFLMASGSADGSVTFWDLETFAPISDAVPDSLGLGPHGRVGSITFTPSGQSLLASYQNSLCVWSWEPPTCLDTVSAEWDNVVDMTIVNNQLIACTVREDQVGTWMVNMQKLTLSAPSGQAVPHKPHKLLDTSHHDYKVNSVRNAIKADSGLAQLRAFDLPSTQDDDTSESSNNYKPTVSSPSTQSPTLSPAPVSSAPVQSRQKTSKKTAHTGASDKGLGIDITPFTQKSQLYDDLDSEDIFMSHVSDYHTKVTAALTSRLAHFKQAKTSWSENGSGVDNKGILAVVGTVGELEDAAVTVEILRMLPHREDYLTLDLCTALLPLMIDLFQFTLEDYLLQALAWTSRLVKAFGHVIKTTREAPPMMKGVDISKEERLEKCQACHGHLVTIQHMLSPLCKRSGSVASNAKDLAALLKIYVPEP